MELKTLDFGSCNSEYVSASQALHKYLKYSIWKNVDFIKAMKREITIMKAFVSGTATSVCLGERTSRVYKVIHCK